MAEKVFLVEGFNGAPLVGNVGGSTVLELSGGRTGGGYVTRGSAFSALFAYDRTVLGVGASDKMLSLGVGMWVVKNSVTINPAVMLRRSNGNASDDVSIATTSSATLRVALGGSVIAEFPHNMVNGWSYLSLSWLSHPTAGSLRVRINGKIPDGWADINAGPTQSAAVAADRVQVRLHEGSGSTDSGAIRFDDLVVVEDAERLKPMRVERLAPETSATSDWAGSDGDSIDNHLLIDEAPYNTTDYIESSTVGDRQVCGVAPYTTLGTPLAIKTVVALADTSGAGGTIAYGTRSGTAEDTDTAAGDVSYSVHDHIVTDKPGGGTWTTSDVTSSQIVVEHVA